ncbi:unnamed protein product [Prorocentrum cordatum]|uniref:Charged multivesicular body protein 3 n=1 Tax=Prorocentrum cordatum TaxID=2364126 RepID=A0ABN9W6M5_9DINO|nr:unnamed protein product [Polarella glacialis]
MQELRNAPTFHAGLPTAGQPLSAPAPALPAAQQPPSAPAPREHLASAATFLVGAPATANAFSSEAERLEAMRMAATCPSLAAPGGSRGGGPPQPPPQPPALAPGCPGKAQELRPGRLVGVDTGTARSLFEPSMADDALGDPEEAKSRAREWQFQLRVEAKRIEMEVKRMRAEERRLRQRIAARAQRGHRQDVQMLAGALVQSRRVAARLESARSAMEACSLQIGGAVAAASAAGALRLSGDVVRGLSQFAATPESGEALRAVVADMERSAGAGVGLGAAAAAPVFRPAPEAASADEVQRVIDEINLDIQLAQQAAAPATVADLVRPSASAASTVLNMDSPAATTVGLPLSGVAPATRLPVHAAPAPRACLAGPQPASGPAYYTQPLHAGHRLVPAGLQPC